ncbi:MAG: replication initiation factor [Herminiimonas sp.]|nr:replication initiation factor [Herminiimonas sp.]
MPAETETSMATSSNRNFPKSLAVQSAVEVSLGDRAATPGDNLGGTEGAPPSNTAPDNSNTSYFQPYRWGVDSLYLSYPGQLSQSVDAELRELKTLAQDRNDLAAKAQFKLGDHIFEVKDKSSGLFPFTIEDDAFQIRFSAHHAKSMPMAYVKVSSRYLSHKTPSEAEAHLRALLAPLGELSAPKVSRIDLFVDFASSVDMESWSRSAWVTKASGVSQYAQDHSFTGWLIGAGSVLMARLYNKQIEIKKSGKQYLEPLWREAGWDSVEPVWRLEFQFKREVLDQLSLNSMPSVVDNLNGLWSYVTTEWLKLTIPNYADKTRSRWPIHPLWMALASIDWETQGGPLLREYAPSRAPSQEWVARRALSAIASFGALIGTTDFNAAFDAIGNAAFNALDDQAHQVGISHWTMFREKVEILNRKYNTAFNETLPDTTTPDLSSWQYRRQIEGN